MTNRPQHIKIGILQQHQPILVLGQQLEINLFMLESVIKQEIGQRG